MSNKKKDINAINAENSLRNAKAKAAARQNFENTKLPPHLTEADIDLMRNVLHYDDFDMNAFLSHTVEEQLFLLDRERRDLGMLNSNSSGSDNYFSANSGNSSNSSNSSGYADARDPIRKLPKDIQDDLNDYINNTKNKVDKANKIVEEVVEEVKQKTEVNPNNKATVSTSKMDKMKKAINSVSGVLKTGARVAGFTWHYGKIGVTNGLYYGQKLGNGTGRAVLFLTPALDTLYEGAKFIGERTVQATSLVAQAACNAILEMQENAARQNNAARLTLANPRVDQPVYRPPVNRPQVDQGAFLDLHMGPSVTESLGLQTRPPSRPPSRSPSPDRERMRGNAYNPNQFVVGKKYQSVADALRESGPKNETQLKNRTSRNKQISYKWKDLEDAKWKDKKGGRGTKRRTNRKRKTYKKR